MKTELVLFGKPINMASRSRRRRLVTLIYAGIGGLLGTLCFMGHWEEVGGLATCAAVFVNLFLGGYGSDSDGMIKPFRGNEALVCLAKKPRSLWSYLFFPGNIEEREYHNDEREVSH
jgi:hypothetical protein